MKLPRKGRIHSLPETTKEEQMRNKQQTTMTRHNGTIAITEKITTTDALLLGRLAGTTMDEAITHLYLVDFYYNTLDRSISNSRVSSEFLL